MAGSSDILGMNARQKLFAPMNSRKARQYTESKLAAKELLSKNEILVPKLFAEFEDMGQVHDFDFSKIDSSFVIKPVGGNAGKGILIVKKKIKNKDDRWVGMQGEELDVTDLKLHVSDILEGQYSTYGTVHRAFVEERVPTHPRFRKFSYKGTPDIRVIVYNKVPVMAMLRLPTKESEGRANLHQGAIGVGIDVATGVTLKGVRKGKLIRYVPDTKRKLNGIRIPRWTSLLKMAVKTSDVSGLGFCGVDLFVHDEKGPMVVELNANPGLDIQIANNSGLRRRLERVHGLKVRDEVHGVKVGKALFAEWFADKVKAEDGLVVVDNFEKVNIRNPKTKKWESYKAKIDTGAFRTSIDRQIAKDLGLLSEDKVLWYGEFRNSMGLQKRPVVSVSMRIKSRRVVTTASIADRSRSGSKILIGRQDLEGFLVNPMPVKDRG